MRLTWNHIWKTSNSRKGKSTTNLDRGFKLQEIGLPQEDVPRDKTELLDLLLRELDLFPGRTPDLEKLVDDGVKNRFFHRFPLPYPPHSLSKLWTQKFICRARGGAFKGGKREERRKAKDEEYWLFPSLEADPFEEDNILFWSMSDRGGMRAKLDSSCSRKQVL